MRGRNLTDELEHGLDVEKKHNQEGQLCVS